jgi:AcrR family transcriptional regulator
MNGSYRIAGGSRRYAKGRYRPSVYNVENRLSVCQGGERLGKVDRRLDRGRATRDRLVVAAMELFAARGFEATSIEAVLEQTGVSRGSLYHHFASKQVLFEAVVDSVEARVGGELVSAAAAVGDSDPVAVLRAGFLAWVRLAADPVVRRILLIDAPAVVGWRRWREIEEQYGLGVIRGVVQVAAEEGRLPAAQVDVFSHMLLAAVNELALLVALADDVPAVQGSAEVAVDELLRRLLPQADPARGSRRRR